MGWLTWKWLVTWVEGHPWQFITGTIAIFGSIGGAVMFRFLFPELWDKAQHRKEEKQIRHYVQKIKETKKLIENGTLSFETTQDALASITLLKKGDEELRNEAYRRIYSARPHSSS